MACRSRLVASRVAPTLGNAARLVSARGFSQTLVTQQKKAESTSAPVFKIDEEFDDYKDVTASNEQLEKNYREPPVQVTSGKHGEFASTLYATASVLNAVEDVERDLKWLVDASQTVPMFQQFLASGLPDKKVMRKLLQGVLKGADFHRLTQKFLVTELLEAGELKLIPDIAAVYAQIMKAHRKEVPVVFTFASLPDKDFLTRQIERVKKYHLDADATPMWEFKINPALIGGFTVEVGSGYKGNFALATQFEHMRQQLKQAEDKWERVRPKDLQINGFDTSNLFAPLSNVKITPADLNKTVGEVFGNKQGDLDSFTLQKTIQQAMEDVQRDHGLSGDYEKNVLEQVRNLDFDKLQTIKQLDLAQHEKNLMKKHNITDNDAEGKRKVKAKIEQLKRFKELDTSFIGEVLKKHQPETYKKYQAVFTH
jgi:F0F1-type ATP synthase delta subunit